MLFDAPITFDNASHQGCSRLHTMNAGGQIEDGELGETVLIIKPLILL